MSLSFAVFSASYFFRSVIYNPKCISVPLFAVFSSKLLLLVWLWGSSALSGAVCGAFSFCHLDLSCQNKHQFQFQNYIAIACGALCKWAHCMCIICCARGRQQLNCVTGFSASEFLRRTCTVGRTFATNNCSSCFVRCRLVLAHPEHSEQRCHTCLKV